MPREPGRKSPEQLLREVEAQESARRCGHLKIFLGYASGVGKSFRMLDEARRRHERGQDVVVGAVQPKLTPDIQPLLANLEIVPLKTVGAGTAIDVESLLRRHPTVCIIDGLAYDNPPGARHPTRWQDVEELLQTDMKVIASVNIQYIAELRDRVEAITGKHVEETVPVAFIQSADEIEIVDAPAETSLDRSPEERSDAAARAHRLSQLRDLTLVLAADVVDRQLAGYLDRHGLRQHFGTQERLLVCITPRANVQEMLDTARFIADRFHADLVAAYVHQPNLSPEDQRCLNEKLALARAAGARIEILDGEDVVGTILEFARSAGITQLFIGHSQRSGLASRLWGNPVDKLVRGSYGMDVRIFPQ